MVTSMSSGYLHKDDCRPWKMEIHAGSSEADDARVSMYNREVEPNARGQARRTAGATQERTLFAVACTPLFGSAWGRDYLHGAPVLSVVTLQYRSA
jgi:hypothetical protein